MKTLLKKSDLPIIEVQSTNYYDLFFTLIEKYSNCEFQSIDLTDSLYLELERATEKNKQFFYFIDFTQLKVIFSSSRSLQMLGLKPEEVNPKNIFIKTHPDEVKRHGIGTTRAFNHANNVYSNPDLDYLLMSTNHRFLSQSGEYINQFVQVFVFKCMKPGPNVFGICIHTDISWFNKKIYGFNNYVGTDLLRFRYPDQKLIIEGCVFSNREFEIIKLIRDGYSSDQIAERLFLSLYTIETHRRNILKKTKKTDTKDVIIDLMERGVL